MQRNNNDRPIKDVINELLESYKLKPQISELKIIDLWKKIMGAAIANRTQNIYVRNNKLYLHTDSSTLRHELIMARAKIQEMLNKEMGEEFIQEVIVK